MFHLLFDLAALAYVWRKISPRERNNTEFKMGIWAGAAVAFLGADITLLLFR